MSLIGKEVQPFKAQAYKNGEFIEVTEQDLKGHWSVVCFYPADFTFVCPTELEDLQEQYATLKSLELKYTLFQQILTSLIKHGMIAQKRSAKLHTL